MPSTGTPYDVIIGQLSNDPIIWITIALTFGTGAYAQPGTWTWFIIGTYPNERHMFQIWISQRENSSLQKWGQTFVIDPDTYTQITTEFKR